MSQITSQQVDVLSPQFSPLPPQVPPLSHLCGLFYPYIMKIIPCPSYRRPFVPNPQLKGLFAGSGSAAMNTNFICQAVVDLTRRQPQDLSLLYIGTATYDIDKYREKQTNVFANLGVQVDSLDFANTSMTKDKMEEKVDKSDIILVSGGNTLYAVDRWNYLGLNEMLIEASNKGKVLCGGSAGAICWFDSGHSDSDDPETYRTFMLNDGEPTKSQSIDEVNNDAKASWDYIRVEGLGILPGLICPHYDRTQSNGVKRMVDFEAMLKRHPYELGLGIDHHAALQVDGDNFKVLSIPGESGSVEEGDTKVPGVWLKYIDDNGVQSQVCPSSGKLSNLLQVITNPDKYMMVDPKVDSARKENPLVKD